jgi:hypothetical protein
VGVGQLDALTSLAADAGVQVGLTVQGVAGGFLLPSTWPPTGSCRKP